jgi:hypothetical protein
MPALRAATSDGSPVATGATPLLRPGRAPRVARDASKGRALADHRLHFQDVPLALDLEDAEAAADAWLVSTLVHLGS